MIVPPDNPRHAAAAVGIRDMRRDFDAGLLERAYEEILRPSFDADELEPLGAICHALRTDAEPLTLAAVAVIRDLPVGMIIAEHYRDSGVLLLAYLAVRPVDRGRGVGGRMLSEVG